MRALLLSALVAILALGGCIKPRPKTGPEVSLPLDVPPPPPRVIAQPEPEAPPEDSAPAASEEPAKEKPRSTRRFSPRPQPEAAKPAEPVKAEPLPPPVEPAKPAADPSKVLQPELKASTPQMVRQVEAQLAQSEKDLGRVYYQGLNADAKTQYDAAKQFIAQARAALKEGNLVFAQKLAEKAVGLASNLVPR